MQVKDILSETYLKLLKKYHIETDDMHDVFDECMLLYKKLDYVDDEDALYDQRLVLAIIEILDTYDFD